MGVLTFLPSPSIKLILLAWIVTYPPSYSHATSASDAEEGNILSSVSRADLLTEEESRNEGCWWPAVETAVWLDYRPLQLCDHEELARVNLWKPLADGLALQAGFEWTSIGLIALARFNRSWIVLGGSRLSDSPLARRDGHVYVCELGRRRDAPSGFGPVGPQPCSLIHRSPFSIGFFINTLHLSDELAAVLFCEPHWFAQASVPAGRCLLFLHRGRDAPGSPVLLPQFCQSTHRPCLTGFSGCIASSLSGRDLAASAGSHRRLLKSLQLWIGEPLSAPLGRVQIVSDPLGTPVISTVDPALGAKASLIGAHFGYSVVDGYATAPGLAGAHNASVGLVGMPTGATSPEAAEFAPIWYAGPQASRGAARLFDGFGLSLARLRVHRDGGTDAIVVGAPFASLETSTATATATATATEETSASERRANRGCVYLFCPGGETAEAVGRPD
ncbi:unnamed protein product, partial [Protopolystoma xenopodis]